MGVNLSNYLKYIHIRWNGEWGGGGARGGALYRSISKTITILYPTVKTVKTRSTTLLHLTVETVTLLHLLHQL